MDIKDNSNNIQKGDTFIALENGEKYVIDAIQKGATKVITKHKNYNIRTNNIKIIYVKNPRKYLIKYLKYNYYKDIEDMNIIGITGTNGKTTTAYLLYQALNLLESKCAYIGTIGFYIDGKLKDLNNTTPDIIELYEMIMEAKKHGCKNVVMEVSSHSLDLKRVDAIKYNYALFTNLTNDHLDYHKSIKKYYKAKRKLLKLLKKDGKIITNSDDTYMKKISKRAIKIGKNGEYKIGDYYFTNKTIFYLNNNKYQMNLMGLYNIYNMSFVIAVLNSMGYFNLNRIIKKLNPPSGRMEIIERKTNKIIVDYAHTPDAVEKIINAVKDFAKNKIYVIIGCGGNRDKTKRPIMASLSCSLADYVIFTSDNPRFERPMDIINDMVKDLGKTNYEVVENRKEAIEKGIQLLKNNDILIVLGKGHEKYQVIGKDKIHFDDVEIINQTFRR